MKLVKSHLFDDIGHNDQEWVGQVEEEPDLHRFDGLRGGEAGGDWEVDRGQDHHAGDVDCDDQLVFLLHSNIVGGLYCIVTIV